MNISYKLWFERPVRCGQVWEDVNQNGCLCLKKKEAKTSFLTSLFSQQFTDYTDSTADMLRFQLAFLKNIFRIKDCSRLQNEPLSTTNMLQAQ